MASGSEMLGMIAGGFLLQYFGIKMSLAISFASSFVGAILVMTYGLGHQESMLFPAFILIMKFGVSAAFNIIYLAHPMIFPVLFAATALGICNFTSRCLTGISPILAQMEEPLPMIVFLFLCLAGVTLVWGIQPEEHPNQPLSSAS